jgi:Zn-dependent peptidase ImmA (M78 family)
VPFRPKHLNYEQLRHAAEEFLDKYHVDRTVPVPIETIVEFDLSMDVIPVDGLKADLKVDAFLTNDLERIYIDEWVMLHAPARFRFSLAHEVGHYWLHDELYQESTIESLTDWAAIQEQIGEEDYKWFEAQANNFAGLVLVPRDRLEKAFRDISVTLRNAGIPESRIDHHPTRQYVISQLADQFKVSEQTMEVRLERDGFLVPQ